MINNLLISAGSSIGGRKENQDNFIIDTVMKNVDVIRQDFCTEGKLSVADKKRYFLICDGMGGMQDGAMASTMAVQYFYEKIPMLRGKCSCLDVYKFILDLNIKLSNYFKDNRKSGGCTFSLLQINQDQTFEVFNIGDSPVWLIRDSKMKMVSEEQNLAGMQLKEGKITEEEYRRSPQKSILLGNLGDESMKSVLNLYYSGRMSYKDGDVILLASDGLAGSLGKDKLLQMILEGANANQLLEEAKKDSRADNITMIKILIES